MITREREPEWAALARSPKGVCVAGYRGSATGEGKRRGFCYFAGSEIAYDSATEGL
jgi:hypothetical protein